MPRAYSMDLRERVVRAYANGEGTYFELGRRFGIGEATANRWVALQRRQGSVKPLPRGGGFTPKLDEAGQRQFRALVLEKPDATCIELVAKIRSKMKISISKQSVSRWLREMGFSRKKRLFTLPREIATGSSNSGKSTAFNSRMSTLVGSFL